MEAVTFCTDEAASSCWLSTATAVIRQLVKLSGRVKVAVARPFWSVRPVAKRAVSGKNSRV